LKETKQIFAHNNKEKMSVVFQLEADMDSKRKEEASSSKLQSMQSKEKDRWDDIKSKIKMDLE
jgi:hypothetical protein